MPDIDNPARRRFIQTAAAGLAAFELGLTALPASANSGTAGALPAASGNKVLGTFKNIQQIRAGDLNIGYVDVGPKNGEPVLLLHGWPYDIYSFFDVAPILVSAGYRVLIPWLRGYGSTHFLSESTPRNGQQAVVAVDAIAFLDALGLEKVVVGGFDWGARTANILAAIWPQRFKALVSVSGYLIGSQAANKKPLPPAAELAWWYQFYFATERGQAGYAANTEAFAKLIWHTASPKWQFSDEEFARSAQALHNPDHVAVSIHNYRWRLGLAEGESKYNDLENRLAASPLIKIPTITLEGDANGAPHPAPETYANKFTGKYQHRTIGGGIGHNLPQEAPEAFAQAILDVANG
ncbi:alpha/beta fold hydrolase [Ewingella sp. AOP9-I1-14]